jgi:hypothetical protein
MYGFVFVSGLMESGINRWEEFFVRWWSITAFGFFQCARAANIPLAIFSYSASSTCFHEVHIHAAEGETLCYTHLAAELRNTTAHTLRCPAAKVTLNSVAASCTFPQRAAERLDNQT